MKYWRALFLFYSCFSFLSCELNRKSATNAAAETDYSRSDSAEARESATATQTDSVLPQGTSAHYQGAGDFTVMFNRFLEIIRRRNAAALNQFIHPEYGLYLIEQPGAVPKFTLVKDITLFKHSFQDSSFFSIGPDLKKCDLQEESLPTFNCDGQEGNMAGYTKQGCFVADATAFKQNEAHKYAGLSATQMRKVEQVKLLATTTVLHTASAYKFHFGRVNGKWYVLFIDLSVPCSA